jgi:DNA-binding transcriptional regulator YiaG
MPNTSSEEIQSDFVNIAFHLYWKHHKIQEPVQYFSLREAMHMLREATGMKQYELAALLWITTNRLNNIELRNAYFSQKQYDIIAHITASYSLPILADYFESQAAYASSKVPATKGRKAKSLGGEDDTPDWVQVMGDGA